MKKAILIGALALSALMLMTAGLTAGALLKGTSFPNQVWIGCFQFSHGSLKGQYYCEPINDPATYHAYQYITRVWNLYHTSGNP